MSNTLEQFAADCHRILKAEPGPEGRQKVVSLVAEICRDEEFITTHVEEDQPERKVIYEDSELGFCILAHHNKGSKGSNPHDHGPAWAIYGQASGETEMTDWEKVEPAGEERKARPASCAPTPSSRAWPICTMKETFTRLGARIPPS